MQNVVLVVKMQQHITHYPCIICTRLLLAADIKEIKYINDYKNDELVEYFCNLKDVKLQKSNSKHLNHLQLMSCDSGVTYWNFLINSGSSFRI